MASVRLSFLPPTDLGIVALHIYESELVDGPFNEIERTTQVGVYPTYIDSYKTDLAISKTDWFGIAWEDDAGTISDMSQPVQGGTASLVGEIVDRARLRDGSLDENILAQEAEAVIEDIVGNTNPDAMLKSDVTASQLSGMVLLTMARAAIFDMLKTQSTSGMDYTAGLVSVKQSSGSSSQRSLKLIEDIVKQANRELGRSYSVVMLMEEVEVAGGLKQLVAVDLSRTIVEFD